MTEPTPKPIYLGEAINTRVLCPHCGLIHDIEPPIVPPEPVSADPAANTRQWATCPTMHEDYLVGIGGYLFLPQQPAFIPV